MCSGVTTPGNSTALSGKTGMLVTPRIYARAGDRAVKSGPSRARAFPRLGPMLRRIDLRGLTSSPDYRTLVPRADFDVESALHVVRPICDDVRDRGVAAILEYSAKFDGV